MASKVLRIIVFIFDLIAFGLAVAAEQRRSTGVVKKDSEDNYQYCVYDSDIATGFGVGAFLFVLISQVLIMIASRCFCFGKSLNPGGSRACACLLFIFVWVTFFIAESCLLAGSVRNAYHYKYTVKFFDNPPTCETVRRGVFAAGAVFVLLFCLLSEFYYVNYSKARGSYTPYGGGGEAGVGMATYK
ncbi:uncharacterized protein [Primulina huaijiensis]|uniref:uncharacterized protein n=1 Tax=Primulina eburnea TaxID=1245227 RepID=UPI003C6CA688